MKLKLSTTRIANLKNYRIFLTTPTLYFNPFIKISSNDNDNKFITELQL